TDINVTATGGGTYTWSGGSSLTTANNSFDTPGTYTVTVTADNGCTATESIVIIQDISVPNASISGNTEICNGESSSITASGGGTYQWNTGETIASISVSPTSTSTYTVTVTSSNACTSTADFTLTVHENPSVDINYSPSCYGESVAVSAEASPTGTYSYNWMVPSGASNPGNNGSFTTNVEGSYYVTITDVNTCSATSSFTLTYPDILDAYFTKNDVSCNGGNDGFIDMTIEGGTPTYSILWSDGDTSEDRMGLTAGTYSVTVTDDIGCTVSLTVPIIEPAALSISETINNVSCNDGDNGSISIVVSGGNAGGYTYLWSNGANSSTINNLAYGIYSVTVTDPKSCTITATYSVTEPELLAISGEITHPKCYGGEDGEIEITISGGTPGYTYTWNGTPFYALLPDLYDIEAGEYVIVVTDANMCTATQTYTLIEPAEIMPEFVVTHQTCDNNNGEIMVNVSGGTPDYSYLWDNSAANATVTHIANLNSGQYSITITDANDCTKDTVVEVERIIPPEIVLNNIVNETCSDENASITVEVVNGRADYNYLWSANAEINSPNITNISAGTHYLTVVDADGCMDTAEYVITNHESPLPQIAHISPAHCDQNDGTAQITVSGGTGDYTYEWNTAPPRYGSNETDMYGGVYDVVVSDGVCDVVLEVNIPNLPGPNVVASATPTVINVERANIHFTDHSTAEGEIVDWIWDFDNGQVSYFQDVHYKYELPGNYNVQLTVTDEFGCVGTDSLEIVVMEDLEFWIPNAFTPDRDGLNDMFGPIASGFINDGYEMVIYDRWGKVAFYSNDYYKRWDGSINGRKVETNSVFVYKISIFDLFGKEHKFRGRVSIIYGLE
ncbi:MAG: PKD domain-containing protein, partial [Bacteroidales bacterium]|nr:PKD domain-containing protein [Bacteroidales bacterium]